MESIALHAVTFTYPSSSRPALKEITYTQKPGEFVVIMGATGAGKSSLARLINGIIPGFTPGSLTGRVLVMGEDNHGKTVAQVARRVGMVFQDFEAQIFSTNVRLEMAFGMENLGVEPEEMQQRIPAMLRMVGLEGYEHRDPATLSGGEKQRLAIAAVLAMRPEVLILDEPTTDLDPRGKEEVFKILRGLRDDGATVVLIEHEPAAAELADRVVLMGQCRIQASGPPRELLTRPEFMEQMSIRPSEVERLFSRLHLQPSPPTLEEAASLLVQRGLLPLPENTARLTAMEQEAEHGAPRSILSVEALSHTYPSGHQALKNVNWHVAEGDLVALVGANGSGKTTLAKHLNGLLRPTTGRVLLQGQDIRSQTIASLGRTVGYCFQNPDNQIFSSTVQEEIAFGPRNMGLDEQEIAVRVADALKTVDLKGREEADPFALTKGERQRVAVASVLAARPPVIVLDEPTTGLDYAEQRKMMDLVLHLNARGHTILLITHSMWVVTAYARRTVVLSEGEIVAEGPTRQIFSREDVLERASLVPPQITRLTRKLGFTFFTAEEYLQCMGPVKDSRQSMNGESC